MKDHGFRPGDLVEVRSATEILRTLDANGTLDAQPFMPEMVSYCGRRFTVDSRAEKLCDTISANLQSRRMANTVFLEDVRCNGSGHGGCQAECRFFWNEAWLRPVAAGEPLSTTSPDDAGRDALLERVGPSARYPDAGDGKVRFRCQATEMIAASVSLSTSDPRPYVRELTSGNVSARTFARVMTRAAVMQPLHHLGKLPTPPLKGPSPKSPPPALLDLQPGEWVRVKSREALREHLTDKGFNRGLWFDREMMAFCGQVFQVHARVTQIIDERTGEMIHLSSDCIMLEDGVCSGERSTGRWFCPRKIYAYWREAWLERVEAPVNAQHAKAQQPNGHQINGQLVNGHHPADA